MNYSDKELIRELEYRYPDCDLIKQTIVLLENGAGEETIDGHNDNDYREHCVSHIQVFAGEDFHQDIIEEVNKLTDIKRIVDRKEHIDYIVGRLNDIDKSASDMIDVIKRDGVIL